MFCILNAVVFSIKRLLLTIKITQYKLRPEGHSENSFDIDLNATVDFYYVLCVERVSGVFSAVSFFTRFAQGHGRGLPN